MEVKYCTLCGRPVSESTKINTHRICLGLKNQYYKLVDNCHGITGGDKWQKGVGNYVVVRPGPLD